MLQNESLSAPPNVLHDRGIPNTLGWMNAPAPVARALPAGLFVAVAAWITVAVVILAVRLA
jgi:hypothetical protein